MAVSRVLCSNQLRAIGHIQAKQPMNAAEVLLQGAVTKPKRRQVHKACATCKRTKAKCSDDRPCARCVRTNQAALYVDCSRYIESGQAFFCADTGDDLASETWQL